jgi:hypothetical protein
VPTHCVAPELELVELELVELEVVELELAAVDDPVVVLPPLPLLLFSPPPQALNSATPASTPTMSRISMRTISEPITYPAFSIDG